MDRQFAETQSERNERMRLKRLRSAPFPHQPTLEVENYRLALAWISTQSTDPKSRELAKAALEDPSIPADEYDHYANEDHMGQGG